MINLLAADIGNWIGLAILVLSVLGWLVNAIKGVDPQGKPLPQRPQGKPKRDLRSEIEVFLEELQQPKPQPPAQPERAAPVPARAETPLVARNVERQRKEKSRKGNNQTRKPEPVAKPQPKGGMRPLSSGPGQGLRQHVSSYMASRRVDSSSQSLLADRVGASVQQHLSGGTVAPVEAAMSTMAAPHPLFALLSTPEGVQQAIVMNEILQRPVSMRGRTRA